MQNKGLLTTFTVLFAIASLYALSLTWVATGVEKDAKEYAETFHSGDSDAEFAYLDSMSSEEVYPFIDYTYGELRTKMLNLGLDLRGGMNVTLEVQTEEVVKGLSSYSQDPAFNKAIKDAKALQRNSNSDFVTLFGQVYTQDNPNGKLSAIFYTLDNKDNLSPNATNEEVLAFIDEQANAAIAQSFEVLNTRINLFGAAQPSIQRLTGSDRILVELPGVKNKERVRQLLQGTAKLEFWLTHENRDVYPLMAKANDKLAQILNREEAINDSTKTDKEVVEDVKNEATVAPKDEDNSIDGLLGSIEETSSADTAKGLLDQIGRCRVIRFFSSIREELKREPFICSVNYTY